VNVTRSDISKIAKAGRIGLVAIDCLGHLAGDEAGGIERMDRHIEEQYIVHLVAKAAEMGTDEEVAMNARQLADRAAFDKGAQAADARNIAAVLHHGMHPAGFLGQPGHLFRGHQR
jgi:hypothetical protein